MKTVWRKRKVDCRSEADPVSAKRSRLTCRVPSESRDAAEKTIHNSSSFLGEKRYEAVVRDCLVTARYLWISGTELRNGVPALVVVFLGAVQSSFGSCTNLKAGMQRRSELESRDDSRKDAVLMIL